MRLGLSFGDRGVAFVGSNPSHAGPESPAIKNFKKWLTTMNLAKSTSFFNVSNEVTPGNRPLKKSEYQLGRLMKDLLGFDKVVALGSTASNALEALGIAHFRLPHPSPKNRVLNDSHHVDAILSECKKYVEA